MKIPQFVQPHTVEIEPYEGEGTYGIVYGTPFNSTGYYVDKKEYIRDDDGDEVVSSSQYYTSEDLDIKTKSKLTFNGNTKEVLGINKNYNAMTGQHSNTVVMLK